MLLATKPFVAVDLHLTLKAVDLLVHPEHRYIHVYGMCFSPDAVFCLVSERTNNLKLQKL